MLISGDVEKELLISSGDNSDVVIIINNNDFMFYVNSIDVQIVFLLISKKNK